jgi:hypothetical protein
MRDSYLGRRDLADFGVRPEIVAKIACTAVSQQPQAELAQCAARVSARHNLAQVHRFGRITGPSLVRLIGTLGCPVAN